MKYRKKPVVIEAVQWTGENQDDIKVHMNTTILAIDKKTHLLIRTMEGVMEALPGDWIIKGIKGEFYPCKPDIFEATYESL